MMLPTDNITQSSRHIYLLFRGRKMDTLAISKVLETPEPLVERLLHHAQDERRRSSVAPVEPERL
jgi:hypothetical protein